jgi:UDP-N-acetylmuramyl tripeptide synthase
MIVLKLDLNNDIINIYVYIKWRNMFILKLSILKTVNFIFKSLGRGSSITGHLDKKLKFNIVKEINFEDKPIVFVMGTNGKTTTSNLIASILKEQTSIVTNHEGANLASGIATTLITNLSFNKKLNGDVIVLEVDEKTIDNIIDFIKPNHILITNFFRDQLDRYGEIDMIINRIIKTINTTDAIVHLNGNDPLGIFRFEKCTNQKVYYGLSEHDKVTNVQSKIIEIKYCPHCLEVLNYKYYHYGHIGNYECNKCDFKQMPLENELYINFKEEYIKINDDAIIEFNPNDFPTYYYFNIISAVSIVNALDFEYKNSLITIFKDFKFPKGRNQHITVNDKEIYFNLAKNVVGMEETIEYINDNYEKFDLLIGFNDNYADGLDVSWIWDTKVEVMKKHLNHIYITGTRRYDMAIRFEAENYENITVIEDISIATKTALDNSGEVLCVISNYTPLIPIDNEIKKWVKANERN